MELNLSESIESPVVETAEDKALRLLKYGIWAYFLLLIFEGALRKWFLPGLATPLLVIRDPIALWLIIKSYQRGLLPSNVYLNGMIIIGAVGFFTAMLIGHGNFIVALYGARILFLHFPLIFVIGSVFDREDILKMGKATLYIAIPMVLLLSVQFRSPQSAWVNRGLAGDLSGAGFGVNGDYFRPPATFSFTNGTALFFGWVAPFLLYFWLNQKKIKTWVLIAASLALLASIPFSISRTLFFEVCITIFFAVMASTTKPENFGRVVLALIVGIVSLAILSQTSYFQVATNAFVTRFTTANESEGGLVKGVIGDRFLGGLISAFADNPHQPFFGMGIGMGTNVGSQLLVGDRTFLIAELEWGRTIGELGPLMGISLIVIRMALAIRIALACFAKLITGDLLPWLLLSYGFVNIAQGQWAQPTSLGFCVMIGGLMLASLRTSQPDVN
ncbi:MAG TPA: hypothetical protein VGN20_21510 [Mucilaginibacter sp.]|jgi:hypothetical protein